MTIKFLKKRGDNDYRILNYNNYLLKKKELILFIYLFFLTGPRSGVLVRCRLSQYPIYLLNDNKICEKNTSFDRSMINLWEPVF